MFLREDSGGAERRGFGGGLHTTSTRVKFSSVAYSIFLENICCPDGSEHKSCLLWFDLDPLKIHTSVGPGLSHTTLTDIKLFSRELVVPNPPGLISSFPHYY